MDKDGEQQTRLIILDIVGNFCSFGAEIRYETEALLSSWVGI